MTVPSGSSASRVSTSGIRPWRRSVDSATSCEEPVKSSSVTRFSPLETTIVTTASHSTSVPAMGSVSMTRPSSTSFDACRRDSTSRFSSSRIRFASASVSPRTTGTVTANPSDTVSSTPEPSSTSVPAGGSCSVTVPSGAQLGIGVSLTSKPRSSRAVTAIEDCSPITDGTLTFSGRVRAQIATAAPANASTASTIARRRVISFFGPSCGASGTSPVPGSAPAPAAAPRAAPAAAPAAAAPSVPHCAVSPSEPPDGSASARSSARRNSSAEAKRFWGSFASARRTTALSAGVTAGLSWLGGRGCSDTCFSATATGLSASKGTRPVSAS